MIRQPVRNPAIYPLVIYAMDGMGDSIYQRPLVRYHAEQRKQLYLRTSWPEFFEDIPGVRFIYPDSIDLRTQKKNIERKPAEFWVKPPLTAERIRARYALASPADTVLSELMRCYDVPGAAPIKLDLPDFGNPPVRFTKYAVVRPVSHRKEWLNTARSPDPIYVARAAELLQEAGYRVVTVADVEPEKNQEWIEKPVPVADREFLHGELEVKKLMALIQGASVVVGGVGWIVPASVAARVPAVFIGGGQGAYNAPEVVLGSNGHRRIRWVLPDRYCRGCKARLHACPKAISDFDARFLAALAAATEPAEAAA